MNQTSGKKMPRVICLSGEIGRRTGLKILRDSTLVPVQVRPQAPSYVEKYPSLVEGTGLENREVVKAAQGFESLFLRHCYLSRDGAARQLVGLITRRSMVQIRLPQPIYYMWSVSLEAYDVCLSRRRSRVQIPYGPPLFLASQLSRQSRGLKILVSLVRFPLKPPFRNLT